MVTRVALILLCFGLGASGQSAPRKAAPSNTHTPAKPVTAPSTGKSPEAIIHTTVGDLKCELFPSEAPKAVANFIGLATGKKEWKDPTTGKTEHKPLYDGVIFHRTIPEFMIQGGDPTGTGSGDVGFEFQDELHPDLLFDKPGRLAMANRGPSTNSSQFFITEKEVPFLNPCLVEGGCPELRRPIGTGYTIFGQCDNDSVELVKKIARMPRGPNDRPLNPVKITHIEIVGASKAAAAKPAAKKPAPAKAGATPKSSPPN
ncbi:MAG: peptidylprolyl isomerase [Candidatus Angelobacter sp.]